MKIYLFGVFCCLFSMIGCSTDDDPIVVPVPEENENLKLVTYDVRNANLTVDSEILKLVFPGNILIIDSVDKKLKFSQESKYTALPVTISSSSTNPFLRSTDFIPSFVALNEFVKPFYLAESLGAFSDFSLSSWHEFSDYQILFNLQELNADLIQFINLLPKMEGKSLIPKSTTSLISRQELSIISIDMNIPKKTELISTEDIAVLSDKNNTYYINSVDYGFKYILITQSSKPAEEMEDVLKKVFKKDELSNRESAILDDITLYVLLRSSSTKDALIKKAKGTKEIGFLISEIDEYTDVKNNFFNYPISFRLRKIDDLTLFNHSYTNEWYSRETEN